MVGAKKKAQATHWPALSCAAEETFNPRYLPVLFLALLNVFRAA
jgi:hypothetical protein